MSLYQRVAAAIATLGLLCSCTKYEPLSLHGAGSMRVEVEVYKGPISLSTEAQIGQTAAIVSDMVRALDAWHEEAGTYILITGGPEQGSEIKASSTTAAASELADTSGLTAEQKLFNQRNAQYLRDRQAYETEFAQAIGQRGVCTVDRNGESLSARAKLPGERDCLALVATYRSSERAISNACFILNTPAFQSIGSGVYLPLGTCGDGAYLEDWRFLFQAAPKEQVSPSEEQRVAALSSDNDTKSRYELLQIKWDKCTTAVARDQASLPPGQAGNTTEITQRFACYREPIMIALDSLAALLRATSYRAADANIRYVPHDRSVRGLIAAYAYTASEYGNQLSSRVDVLREQLVETSATGTSNARFLPTSAYLRGASNTDFVHLYDWLEAADKRYLFDNPGKLDTAARVRMAERLNSDYYWEKVNEVYASGQGDVSMAFIKDALGNWNLKSFSNDPAELLAAYRDVTSATLKTAAKLAVKAGTGGVGTAGDALNAVQKAAQIANQLASGESEPTTGVDVTAMHARVVSRIRAREQSFLARAKELLATIKVSQEKADALQLKVDAAAEGSEERAKLESDHAKAIADRDAAQLRLEALPQAAIMAYRDILEDHASVIISMQDALVPAETQAAPASPPGTVNLPSALIQ